MQTRKRPDVRNTFSLQLTAEEKALREQFSATQLSKGFAKGAERANELFGVEVSEHYIRRATYWKKTPRLNYRVIGNTIYYSDRDLFDFFLVGHRTVYQEVTTATA